jgi:type IV fimbrial biogenesis protein FimT
MCNAAKTRFCALRPRRIAGVSLVELLAVVAIVAILMSIGLSSFKSLTISNRISGEINDLLGDMQYGRSEGIKQGQNVTVCVSTTGTDCSANNYNWNLGWIVFLDVNNAKTTSGNSALVLRAHPAFTGTDTLTDGATSNISFDREGLALGLTTTMSGNGGAVLPLHDSTNNATRTRCLEITNIGNLSVQQTTTLATCT